MHDSKIIQGFWLGKELSLMEKLSISSFINHGHEYHLYVYDEITDVPVGTVLKDAIKIIPRQFAFEDNELKNSYANFSDIFRYKLLFEKGGYWVDTDLICLRRFDYQSDYVFAQQRDYDGSTSVNGCVTKAPRCSEIMQHCYTAAGLKARGKYEWWELGPPLLNEAVNKFGLAQFVLSYKTFIPIDWMDWKDIINHNLFSRLKLKLKLTNKEVYAIHLWSSMWKRENADKNGSYHPKCLYERLKAKYL